jgi:O-antigen ligase
MESIPTDPWVVVAAVAFLALMPAVRYRTAWLAAIVVFLWADSLFPGRAAALSLRAPVLLALLLFGAFRFRGVAGSVRPPLPALLLAALAAVSVAYAEDRAFAALSVSMLVAVGLLTFAYLPRMVGTVDGVRRAYLGLVVTLCALLVVGLVPIGRVGEEMSLELGDRWRGFFANPNALGSTCAFLMPWIIVLTPRERGRGHALGIGAVVALVVLCFLSGSRTAFAGMLVGGSVALWHRVRARVVLGFAVGGVVLGAVAVGDVDLNKGKVGDLVRGETISDFSGRLDLWRIGARLATESPVLGHGYKGHRFVQVVEEQSGGRLVDIQMRGANFHSQHVETLVDLGVPGEALLLLLLWVVWKRLGRIGRDSRDPSVHAMRAALLGTHLYVVLDSFLNNWLLTPGSPPALLYWSLMGLAFRLEVLASKEAPAVPLAPPGPAAAPAAAPA